MPTYCVATARVQSSFTLPIPAQTLPGDLIVVHLSSYNLNSAATLDGFTSVFQERLRGGNESWGAVWLKVATSGDAGRQITVSNGGPYPSYSVVQAIVMRNVNTVTVAGVATSVESSTITTGPITTTTRTRRLVVMGGMFNGVPLANLAAPAGYATLAAYDNHLAEYWQNAAAYWAPAPEVAGVLPSLSTSWGFTGPSAGISLALEDSSIETTAVGASTVTARLFGGYVPVFAGAAGVSGVVAGLYRFVSVSGWIDPPSGGPIQCTKGPRTYSVNQWGGVLVPASSDSGTGPTPPPTTGQIWPR